MEGRRKRTELLSYYGASQEQEDSCYNINSKHFNAETYMQKLLEEKNLKQIIEEESEMVSSIQRLDSECQTLVYNHYDKFIAATEIVRQMKEGSSEMSTQVSHLQEHMHKITESSESITTDLQGRRDNLSRLLGIHSTLKKLQFVFQLPQTIDVCISEGNFIEGVRSYLETAEVLQRYQHLPSFTAIYSDCQDALNKLNTALKEQLATKDNSARHLTECVDLLLQLGEPSETLCDVFLSHARDALQQHLKNLSSLAQREGDSLTATKEDSLQENSNDWKPEGKKEVANEMAVVPMDILQFMDVCHDTFVSNLWLVISSYKEMFLRNSQERNLDPIASEKLYVFVCELVKEYVHVVGARMNGKTNDLDYMAISTALDKFYRRLHAISQLLPNMDFTDHSFTLIENTCQARCESSLQWLKDSFASLLVDIRQALSSPKQVTQDSSTVNQLNELLTKLIASTAANIRNRITALKAFLQPKHTFAMQSDFQSHFSRILVREKTIVQFFIHITNSLQNFCTKKDKDPTLLLILSRFCLDMHTSTIHYLLSHCDEELQLENKSGLTSLSQITSTMNKTGQRLLNYYVTLQGSSISQMLRRSVELKDWLGCSEPRTVRKVMRTIRDEITAIDSQVGSLYEEGTRKERSSDSSRRTYLSLNVSRAGGTTRSGGWTAYSSSVLDNSLVANLSKLWSEKIEIFSPVQFTRVSILTGIIKISLKTLLESVRLSTFSRFGFQQMQVDAHYLRIYLWSYVADEHILNALLEEICTSASLRCTDPELMDQKVVEFICEEN